MIESQQAPLEASRLGRACISALVALTLAAVVVSSLPASKLQRGAVAVLTPYLRATGLAQDWDVFAPDPARRSLYVSAVLRYADGSVAHWRVPEGGRLVAPYRFYRWRKLATALQDDAYRDTLWPAVARWLADTHERDGQRPVTVTLIRRWAPTPPPGPAGPVTWYDEAYYTLDLSAPPDQDDG